MQVGVRRPDWWCYPERRANGHEWGPGRVLVSFTRCDCPPVREAYGETGGLGHLTVASRVPGRGSVWYRLRREPGVWLVLVAVAHLVPEPLQFGVSVLPVLCSQREKSPRNLIFGHAQMTPVLFRGHGGDAPPLGEFFPRLLAFLPVHGPLLAGGEGAWRRAAGLFASAPAAEADPERSPVHAEPHSPPPMAGPVMRRPGRARG